MKSRHVWVHVCDYCGKKLYRKPSMEKHEKTCTLNPQRVCGICRIAENVQPKMSDLLAVAGIPADYIGEDTDIEEWNVEKLNTMIPKLKEVAGYCPACVLAALRQAGLPAPLATEFDFKSMLKEIWDGVNDSKMMGHSREYTG